MAFSWKHVVPWTNRAEFVRVYEDLYSSDAHRQKSAVEEIAVWKSRAMHKLSVAIESTAALTDAFLQHHDAVQTDSLPENDYKLRAVFSLALIRFVNHITEKGQNKAFAQPVHRIAQEFGIPEWIVRLRHDATHGSLPCLDVLTKGTQWALSYLQDVFWSQQLKDPADGTPSPKKSKRSTETDVCKGVSALSDFQDTLHSFQKASHKSLEDGPESEAARNEGRALKKMEVILSSQRRNYLVACLIEPSHLLATEEQLRDYEVNLEDTVHAEPPKVPGILVNIWRSLLRLLQSRQLTSLLLQHMLRSLVSRADASSLHSRLLAAWLRFILLYESSNFEKSADERASQPELYRSSVEFNKEVLLATCLRSASVWACCLLPLLTDPKSLPGEIQNKLEALEDIYRGRVRSDDADRNMEDADEADKQRDAAKIFSVADLKNVQRNLEGDEDDGNIWQLCTEPVDWDRVAWGLVPGHTLAETCRDYGSEMEEEEEIGLGEDSAESSGEERRESPGSNDDTAEDRDAAEEPTWTERQSSPLLNKIDVG